VEKLEGEIDACVSLAIDWAKREQPVMQVREAAEKAARGDSTELLVDE